MHKVTVVTITYNSSKFVRQAIESILAQSYADFEYIISDDCSTDNTWKIIQEYKDPRIKAWRNETNMGEYPNRNLTLNETDGEYVIWIDGDDILYPHGLEFMVKMLDAFPQSATLSSRPYSDFMIYPVELSPRDVFRLELMGSPVLVNGFPDTLFRTAVLKNVDGFSLDHISGDTYAKRKIALEHHSLFVSNGLSWWRKTDQQASKKLESIDGLIQTTNMQLEFISKANSLLSKEEVNHALDRLYAGLLRKLVREYLIRGRFSALVKVQRRVKLSFIIWRYLIIKRLPEFKLSNAENPLQLPFDKNPLSRHENL